MFPLGLDALIEIAKSYSMTPEERIQQTISFTYGNLILDGCNVTREGVEKVVREFYSTKEAPPGARI